jgi:hypothetical protein
MVIVNKDEVFYDYVKSFTIWETFWLCVWPLSMFASFFCTFCCKVCNLVQTLIETQLVQSHKKLPHTILETQILGVGVPMDSQTFRGRLQGSELINLKNSLYH